MEDKEKVVEEVQEKKKATRQKKEKEVKEEPKKLTLAEKRKILKDCEVCLMNNTGAYIMYRDNKTMDEIELPTYGDTDIIEIELVRRMAMKSRGFFEKYWVLVTDFICDDERIQLEDVYDYLGISKYYNKDEDEEIVLPNGDFFDDILLTGKSKTFKKYVDNMNNRLLTQLVNRAVMLYKEGKFDSSVKIQILEEKINREGFFLDIKVED